MIKFKFATWKLEKDGDMVNVPVIVICEFPYDVYIYHDAVNELVHDIDIASSRIKVAIKDKLNFKDQLLNIEFNKFEEPSELYGKKFNGTFSISDFKIGKLNISTGPIIQSIKKIYDKPIKLNIPEIRKDV